MTPRPLTDDETQVLTALTADLPDLAGQIPDLKVVGSCPCGCPTRYYANQTQDAPVGVASADAGTDGVLVLFAAGGQLDALHLLVPVDDQPGMSERPA